MPNDAKSESIWTPPFVIIFPQVFTPDKDNEKFGCKMLFDESKRVVDLGQLNTIVESVTKQVFPKKRPSDSLYPIEDGNDKYTTGKAKLDNGESASKFFENYKGMTVVRANTKFKPDVLDNVTGRAITDETEIYTGCICRARVHAYAFQGGMQKGACLRLEALEKLRDGTRLGGSASEPIEAPPAPDLSEFDDFGF